MDRLFDSPARYSTSPTCAHGLHDCDSVTACCDCEGRVYCEQHIQQCEYCRKNWCERHAKLIRTDCWMLCPECAETYAPEDARMEEMKNNPFAVLSFLQAVQGHLMQHMVPLKPDAANSWGDFRAYLKINSMIALLMHDVAGRRYRQSLYREVGRQMSEAS